MKKRILFVEDEAHVLELVAYRLRKSGYEVLTATDGVSGLVLAQKENPDLVILDLNIPGISGEEVCRQIKQDKKLKKIPVLIMTASADEIDEKVKNLKAEDSVIKPYEVLDLLSKVKKYIGE